MSKITRFDITKIDFLHKLGEGIQIFTLTTKTNIIILFIGAFGKVKLGRRQKEVQEYSTDEESTEDDRSGGARSNKSSPVVLRKASDKQTSP